MTEKEKAYIKAHENKEGSLCVLALKLFRKELVKNLQKKGYDVDKSDFGINKDPGADANYILFKGKRPFESPMFFPTCEDLGVWKTGDESILKTCKGSEKYTGIFSGKEWIKKVEDILKEHGMYEEPVEEKEEGYDR